MDQNLQVVMDLLAVPGEPGRERAVSDRVRELLAAMGVPAANILSDNAHRLSEYGGEAGNLIVRFPGRGRGAHRMLSTHLDTVPGAVGSKPRLDGDRVVNDAPGRALGADARAGVAVLLAAARALAARRGEGPPRTLCFFVQEEVGLVGSRGLDVGMLGDALPEMCFNFDGGDAEEVASAVVGTERLVIDLRGLAVHTSRAAQGISCAVILAEALAELERAGWFGEVERDGAWAAGNLGVIRGGTGSNVVMPELHALAECRSFSPELRERVLEAWRDAFRRAVDHANAAAAARGVEPCATVSFSRGPEYKPYELPDDHPAVAAACAAIRRTGRTPRLFRHKGGMDTCNVVAKGIPAVGMGMGDRGAHSVGEWLDVPHFLDACRIAVELAVGEGD